MQHFYRDIKGWAAFLPLYDQAVADAPDAGARFVEVGSWLGRSAAYMAVQIENSRKAIEFVCVDPWIDGGADLKHTEHFKTLGVHEVYDTFRRNMRPVEHRIKAMRFPSVEAARFIEDDSVDFIMLDGDHSYEAVMADIAAWSPKMKKGSVMSGDDYGWPGVKQAVDETFGGLAEVVWLRRHANYLLGASYWSVKL